MNLSRDTKGYIACFVIFAVIIFAGFIEISRQQDQIEALQKVDVQRSIFLESTRYENCLAANKRIEASNELNEFLQPALLGLARLADGAQESKRTSDALRTVAGFIKEQPPAKCYIPEGYIKSD